MLSLLAVTVVVLAAATLHPQVVIVGLGQSNSVASSATGVAFTGHSARQQGNCPMFDEGSSVAFSSQQSLWVATGIKDAPFFTCGFSMAYSRDGVSWTGITNTPFADNFFTGGLVAYSSSHNQWLALGERNTCGYMASSSDGINWGACMKPPVSTQCIASGNGVWMLGGRTPQEIGVSSDLVTWTTITGVMETVSHIAYSAVQNKFVAVGQGGTTATQPAHFVSTLAVSTNGGLNWTKVPSTSFVADEGFGVAYSVSRNQWIAVGSYKTSNTPQGIVATSTDAITWTTVSSHPFNTTSGSRCDAIVFSETLSLWILSGDVFPNGVGQSIATSPDGLNWTLQSTGNDFISVSAIAVSNNATVAATTTGATLTTTGSGSTTTSPADASIIPFSVALLVLACVFF
jgi:hypothetical protein